jgi:hypothetical protein
MNDLLSQMYNDQSEQPLPALRKALFKLVYCGERGVFNTVCARVQAGTSVLLYLPGKLMDAAVEVLKEELGDAFNWHEYLDAPEGSRTLGDKWEEPKEFVTLVNANLRGEPDLSGNAPARARLRPAAVFRNLDMLADGHGGVHARADAQTAFLAVVEGARRGTVVGLSDIREPELPGTLTRAFGETVRIQGIPYERFKYVVPKSLGISLEQLGRLDDGFLWQLHARLRWTDPWEAYFVMWDARGFLDIEAILEHVTRATRSSTFLGPDEVFDAADLVVAESAGTQFSARLELLRLTLVKPFQKWKNFRGTVEECRRLLRRLPAGTVLYGPPGTGKTHLARWIAKEIGLPVRIVSGAEIRAPAWGEAERKVGRFFDELRRAAPCVVILDEADDLLTARDEHQGGLASAERAVVNEFLQQLDGVRGRLDGVLVIATTNRADHLDPAAKVRLSPIHHVPYPQERSEVGVLVDHFASLYHYRVTPDIRQRLVDFFFAVVPGRADPGGRLRASSGEYFSPRDIAKAMRMLNAWTNENPAQEYQVEDPDVQRIINHFTQG